MTKQYRDFSLNFYPNPVTGDVSTVSDEKSIAQSMRNIIMTDRYEVPFQPDFGGNIRNMLFELASPFTLDTIKSDIKTAIENYEPRVNIVDLSVNFSNKEDGVNINIVYRARTSTSNISVNFFLKRVN